MNCPAPVGRVYRMSWWFRGFALFILVTGCILSFLFLRDISTGNADPDIAKTSTAIILPIAGMLMTTYAFVSKMSFRKNTLQKATLFNPRIIPLSSIRGRREFVVTGGSEPGSTRYLRLELNNGDPPVDLGKRLYNFDDAFWSWFRSLPDLDAADKVPHKDSDFGLV